MNCKLIILVLSALVAFSSAGTITIDKWERQPGDELIYNEIITSNATSTPSTHEIRYFWESDTDFFTLVQVIAPDTVS